VTIDGFLRVESLTQRRWAIGLCGGLTIVTILFSLYGRARGPTIDPFLVVATLIWAFCDLLTAFLLFSQSSASRRLDFGILASGYLLSGILSFPYIGAYTGVLGTAANTVGDQQLPAVFFFVWHISFAAVAVASVAARTLARQRRVDAVPPIVAITTAFALGVIGVAFGMREQLPHFIVDGVFQPVYWAGGVPAMIISNGLACAGVLLVRGRVSSLRIWLAVALYGACLEGVLNLASPQRFSYAWDFSKAVATLTSLSVMYRILFDIVRMYRQVSDIVSIQSGQAAARIRAIWQIATSEGLSEDDHTQMILDVAVANSLPGRNLFGSLSHLETGRVVVDAIARSGDPKVLRPFESAYEPGTSFSPDADVHAALLQEGRTRAWESPREIPSERLTAIGAGSAIGTPIHIGPHTHFVVFTSTDPTRGRALGDMDYAFVDVVAANISQSFFQRSQRERMDYYLEHDTLTGLANRTQFVRSVHAGIADETLAAVVLIDLDGFGLLNERVGQAVCDDMLVEIGATLRAVDEGDAVFRLSGDEFGVALYADGSARSTQQRTESYRDAFRRPFATGDRERPRYIPVLASLGAAELDAPMTYDELMQRANVALEESQAIGAKATVYSDEMIARLQQRRVASDELIGAMARDEFVLQYQPTVELATRSIAGAEALLRWNHPQRGLLAPTDFLDAAKRAGLMGEITHWVIRRLVADLETLDLPQGFRCYFNVPAQVLEDFSFSDMLADIVRMHPRIADRLGLEVTESDVMNQVERAIESLTSVRRLGLLVAVDDFGTGYSSMGYLKRLPIDSVKLDGSFIKGLPGDSRDENLAKLFLGITSQFSLVSVAEGVETEAQAQWLMNEGCILGQGYLFAKPLALADLVAELNRSSATVRRRRK
jgi:diguanylate cyclase (GGDEF)-like protein